MNLLCKSLRDKWILGINDNVQFESRMYNHWIVKLKICWWWVWFGLEVVGFGYVLRRLKIKNIAAQTFPVEYLHRMLKKWQKWIFAIPSISKLWTNFTIVFISFIKIYSNIFIKVDTLSTFVDQKMKNISEWFIDEDFCFFRKIAIHPSWNKKKGCGIFCKKKEDFTTCLSCIMFGWHKSCIEKICVDFSLNKPDFSSEKWSCPNCCKIWIIMSFWIHLRVVDQVNKESTFYWLMCHEHFESIWLTGDTVFTDFNPTLFSKMFFV